MTLGIFRSTGNESTNSSSSLGICGFSSIHFFPLQSCRVILRQAASCLDNPKFIFLDATVVDDVIRFVSERHSKVQYYVYHQFPNALSLSYDSSFASTTRAYMRP
ncbi:MAG TPA: hypothetical protein VI278_10370 [Nitrososphaeraceae archaeon]